MLEHSEHLCSDLVTIRLSTGACILGHLETISASGCEVTLDEPVALESVVALECVECPKGETRCIQCRMTGTVTQQEADHPLGIRALVTFTDGGWCPERWQPRHLLDPRTLEAGCSLLAVVASAK